MSRPWWRRLRAPLPIVVDGVRTRDLARGVWAGKTIYRCWMEHLVRDAPLSGRVLDLGGGGSGLVRSDGKITRALLIDIRQQVRPDVVADLRSPLPFADQSVDAVMCLNVLEHVRDGAHVIRECARVLREGGVLVLCVPFLYPLHTAQHPEFFVDDFIRYSESALRRLLLEDGRFRQMVVRTLGCGPFTAAANILVTEFKLRVLKALVTLTALALDRVHGYFHARRRSIARTAWPIGYYVEAIR